MAENAITPSGNGSRMDPLKSILRNPATRLLLLLFGVAGAVAFGVAIVLWSRGPNYGLLYAGLDPKDAASVTQALQSTNTPYQLGADGASISVPAADLANTRLRLASQGLPQGSTAGATSPQGDSPFGMSDLAESTHYQQMLETDLGNTIAGLQFVRAARVHLALPKASAFIRDNHPAGASVLVTLYPGRQLDSSQVAAIVHLVSSSVPDLDPSQVSVVDQQGALLTVSDPDSPGAVGDMRLRLATRMENSYAQRIEQLLTPLVGQGRVRAQVYADLDFSQTEKATESYDNANPAVRSEQTSSVQKRDDVGGAIAGALSNQPPNTVPQPTAAKPGATPASAAAGARASTAQSATPTETSSNSTRNYELGRTISHVSDPAGRLTRLTVAVVVDNKAAIDGKGKSVPFSPQDLQHLTDLTKNAVGFDAQRGDSVSVINQAFTETPHEEAPFVQPLWERPGMMDLIKQGVGILIALLIAFGLLRPMLKGLMRAPEPLAALTGPMPTMSVRIADDEYQDERDEPVRLSGSTPQLQQTMAYEQKIGLARKLVQENPKQVAQVVMNWVGDDGG
jgi:flagellar M-ring protein FliF